jgi:hypothetical protein
MIIIQPANPIHPVQALLLPSILVSILAVVAITRSFLSCFSFALFP